MVNRAELAHIRGLNAAGEINHAAIDREAANVPWGTLLRSPELRQLDQRVSIRYQLEPLDRETVGAYIAHRLTIAGASAAVTFAPKALDLLHRLSGGIPRLINLICDRALLAAFSVRENRITPDMVTHAAESLDVRPSPRIKLARRGAPLAAAAAVALVASAFAVGSTAYLYQRFADPTVHAAAAVPVKVIRGLPSDAAMTILVGTYPASGAGDIQALTERLETSGYTIYYADLDLGPKGRWQRVLAGAYTDPQVAQREADRVNLVVPGAEAHVIDVQRLRSGF